MTNELVFVGLNILFMMKIKLSDINKNICKYYILNMDNQYTLCDNRTIKQFFVSLNRR